MPGRSIPLVTSEIYHVFNRGVDHRPTFINKREYKRAMTTFSYYRFISPEKKLSYVLTLSLENREDIINSLVERNKILVEILAFCLMPNHFHFLLKQLMPNGISKFMSNFQNSYTRFFNTKHERQGPLFLDQFKAIRIETDEQLLHVSRYIHLNPLTSYILKDFESLKEYSWSSLKEYLRPNLKEACSTQIILDLVKNIKEYEQFVEDQIDYQRKIHQIKHLTFE